MKVTLQKQELSQGLGHGVSVAEKKTTMPILGNILWRASEQGITISATDLEISLEMTLAGTVITPGAACIPAQHLMNIVKELPNDMVSIEVDQQGWVRMHCGKAQFKIASIQPEEFPKLAKREDFQYQALKAATLMEAFDRTAYAICTDEMRYNLNGSLVETETTPSGKRMLKVVSTDGHRLAFYQTELGEGDTFSLPKGVIFPRKGILEIRKILSDLGEEATLPICIEKNTVAIKHGEVFLTMKLVVGEFPDYTKVIPQNNDKKLKVSRDLLSHSLRRVSLLSEGKSKCVKLGIHGGGVLLRANSPELGEAEEEIVGEFDGGELTIGFNAKYVMDVLSNMKSEEVVLELSHGQSPGVFRIPDDPTFFGVIMPMRT